MRRIFILQTAILLACVPASARAQSPGAPLRVCILSGCETYQSEESLPPFQQWLEENYHVRCTRVVRVAVDDLPGLEKLDDCDVALVFIKRMKLKDAQLEQFKKYATSGKPIVGVRTASHAVQTWLDFDHEVLGGNYHSHYPVGPVTAIDVVADAASHPILRGVKLATAAEPLYKNSGHAADINILLRGAIPDEPTEPIAWTREHRGGRVFYTSLGAQPTFLDPNFRRMLANALFWTAHREPALKNP
jgi:type 1 glutamine amidotransferase